MDVCESEQALRKHRTGETPRRLPLVPAEKNNAITSRRSGTREVSSRYKSPTPLSPSGLRPASSSGLRPASPSGPRRCPSPISFTRTTPASSKLSTKRAQSAERKRPATPPSPPSPSTPVQDSTADVHLSRRVAGGRLPESLWPSTMRSLSVSFQSDTISIPVTKKEKPVTSASDRTLRPTSNVAHRQVETPNTRKPTPERKRSPLKGKNASDQSENSKPVDGLHSRLIDQHRWPSRIGGKVSSNPLNRSVDHFDKATRTLNTSVPGTGVSSLRRLSLPGDASMPLLKSSSDVARLLSHVESGRIGSGVKSVDDSFQILRPHKSVSATPSDRTGLALAGVRSQTLPTPGSRLPSPSRTSVLSSSSSRGVSPSRSRPSTPPRGVTPSRIRSTDSSNQSNNSISVLSFIADFRKGKKGAAYIEDAHQLRLLYNRYLQWRFANARAEDVFYIQNAIVEKTLYNVWNTTLSMWESIIRKRIHLQQLQLELKLNSILNDQMTYLDDWAVLESDHVDALSGAVEDLEANTLRLPLTGGAKADIENLKVAICSAVDIMQAMGSAIRPLFSRVECMNNLISEVAVASAQEKAMLDECEALLTFATSMQLKKEGRRNEYGRHKLEALNQRQNMFIQMDIYSLGRSMKNPSRGGLIRSWRSWYMCTKFMLNLTNKNQVHAALEEELAFLKQVDQFSDGQSIPSGNSRYLRLLSVSPDAKVARIASLENMLSLSLAASKAMTSQLTEAKERERTLNNRGRWIQLRSMGDAKSVLQFLFNVTAEARLRIIAFVRISCRSSKLGRQRSNQSQKI